MLNTSKIAATLLCFAANTLYAQIDSSNLRPAKNYIADEVIISATRAKQKSATPFSTVTASDIEKNNLAKDIPSILELLPSVVTTSDAGAGVGYTGIRLRGSDATRINVTINGIPVNDAESQGMYWVDLPDLASSIEDMQVQRGVGTSTNGAGAFGGSINILTNKLSEQAYAETNFSYGTFNTCKATVKAGTGLLANNFAVDARLSKINSDGYIDRATADLKSFFVSGGYYGKKTLVKLNVFSGKEITYQAWYGTPEARINNDDVEMQNYIYRNGLDDEDATNLLNAGRTYNFYTYKNQVDNYQQDYYQLHFSHLLSNAFTFNAALHYTKGKGYYEEFKKNQPFEIFGWNAIIVGADTIDKTNLVRRKWLDNDFYGATYSVQYTNKKNIESVIGGAWNQYDGDHYTQFIWQQYAAAGLPNDKYYLNNGLKTDFNIFLKTNFEIKNKINAFVDVQLRNVGYNFTGFDELLNNVPQTVNYVFINPKTGVSVNHKYGTGYISVGIGNKEPSRDDFTDSSPASRPKSENLTDLECGYKLLRKKFSVAFNYYLMIYKNQLVLTGRVNDVGNYTRTNVNSSYREGWEVEASCKPFSKLTLQGNATLSNNKIKKFVQFTDAYDENYNYAGQKEIEYKNTHIAFSPKLIAAGQLSYDVLKNFKATLINKYVSAQYLDNTSNNTKKLNAYSVTNFQLTYALHPKFVKEIGLNFTVYNLLNSLYQSNGYTWGYYTGQQLTTENFYYPQAGRHFMAQVAIKF